MFVYAASLLPPNNLNPTLTDHTHFSFTCTIQLGLRSPKNKIITDYPGPSSPEFPFHELHRRPDPSSQSWKAVEKLISSLKKLLFVGNDVIIQWNPNPLYEQHRSEEHLIRHVLAAAHDTVARQPEGKKPSSLCLKIKRVVEVQVWEFMSEWIMPRMKPFRSDNSLYEDFKGIFSKDVEAARIECRRLCQVMYRDFGVAVPDEQGVYSVLVELREWKREERDWRRRFIRYMRNQCCW